MEREGEREREHQISVARDGAPEGWENGMGWKWPLRENDT
jgi:hypothetical protein